MNWEMIGAVGELLGAVVVVGSIVYLASQVRHNTAVARSDVGRELAASYNDWTFGMATDERLPALWVMNVYERISLQLLLQNHLEREPDRALKQRP